MPNVLIFGSCVSRDTRPFLGEDWKMIEYVARQSFISAAAGSARLRGVSKLTSAFQNKCLQNDFDGSFLPTLIERAAETDLVIMDLVDERLGVQRTPDGGYVTNSWELSQSGLIQDNADRLSFIDFATDEHFEVWCDASRTIIRAIRRAGLPMVVLAPAWAAHAEDPHVPVNYRGIAAAVWNDKYVRYVDHLETLGVKVVRIPPHEVRSSTTHQWGLAPFHYDDRVYEVMQAEIKHHHATVLQRHRGMSRLLSWRPWRSLHRGSS
ncbi:MAG: DUF6270 domain-containing protein [Arachnia sp.]